MKTAPVPLGPPGVKRCPGCCPEGEGFAVWFFPRDRTTRSGFSNYCKRCKSKKNASYIKNRMSPHAAAMRESYRLALVKLSQLRRREYVELYGLLQVKTPLTQDRRKFYGRVNPNMPDEERWPLFPDTSLKKCRVCGKVSENNSRNFYVSSRNRDGRAYLCKSCQNERSAYRESDKRSSRLASKARVELKKKFPAEFNALREHFYLQLSSADETLGVCFTRPQGPDTEDIK